MRILQLLLLSVASTIAHAQDSLNVTHLFNWDDPTIPVGSEETGNKYNEVWGYASEGREYAFLGSTLGVHVFDVTDAENAVLVDHIPGRFSGVGVVHRDYKVYAGHLYAVCDQGPSSLQIMDLQYLPDSVHVVYDSPDLLVRAHNIQVDTVNARLYVCGGELPFRILSLSDPAAPTMLSDLEADIPWWGNTVGYVHDCFVRDNIVWCNDEDGMHVVDFTDVEAPLLLGSLTDYEDQGYNHSGWMNDDNTLYVMADETHGSPLKFIDPTDLSDLHVISTVSPGTHPYSLPHNPFFHGDLVHVAYYADGYWLWDATDPLDPVVRGFYNTGEMPHTLGYRGAWGVYPYLPSGKVLVSDMQTGFWVLDIEQNVGVSSQTSADRYMVQPTLTDGPVTIFPLVHEGNRSPVELMDASGRLISTFRQQTGATRLDLAAFADGVYLIRIITPEGAFTQRVVKSR